MNFSVTNLGLRDGLYHKDIYLPQELLEKLPDKINTIVYTKHAVEIAQQRKIRLPDRIYGGQIFEVEIMNNTIVKACYRIRSYKNTDLCLVFHTYPSRMLCITAWLNDKTCVHTNLKKRYNYVDR